MAPSPSLPSARPLFVVLDGVDGCGKTTQAERLAAALGDLRGPVAPPPLHAREPGSTPLGEHLRGLLLDGRVPIGRLPLALLFLAARRELLEREVWPALDEGRDVVVERHHSSTFAYQGTRGDGLGGDGDGEDERFLTMLRAWTGERVPDVEVILTLDPRIALDRARAREANADDRFESGGVAFQELVAERMRRYVERTPAAVAVDAGGAPDEVATRVLDAVLEAARAAGEGAHA
jgi:dTMP kinase